MSFPRKSIKLTYMKAMPISSPLLKKIKNFYGATGFYANGVVIPTITTKPATALLAYQKTAKNSLKCDMLRRFCTSTKAKNWCCSTKSASLTERDRVKFL